MASPSHNAGMKLCLRLHPGRDADLVDWLATLDDLPFGGKGEAVKAVLRRGMGTADLSPVVDVSALLPQVRAVVEAAVTSAMTNAHLVMGPLAAETPVSESDALLDAFAANLTL